MIVELKEKLVIEERRTPSNSGSSRNIEDSRIEDSLRALIELGYRKQNAKVAIDKALNSAEADKLSVSDLIRSSLKYV